MTWYYVDAGAQAGPVDDAQLEQLARSGKIQPDTLIWREGMANWQPYSEVVAPPPASAAPVPVPPPPSASADLQDAPTTEAVCAECGRIFNIQDMIPYGGVRVCAGCKPVFMQKLAEGARLNTGVLNYAGIGTRFAAVFLDGIILWVVNTVINLAAGAGFAGAQPMQVPALWLLLLFVQVAIALTYEVVMIGKFGATLGKMACKIRVVTPDGGRVSYLRALGRYFAKMLSGLMCLVGYIIAFFDDEKRALHDRICNTRVVMK